MGLGWAYVKHEWIVWGDKSTQEDKGEETVSTKIFKQWVLEIYWVNSIGNYVWEEKIQYLREKSS